MLVDMLPARLGELSYIGMMNRGYKVSGKVCVSSLGISFVFDFIALLFVVVGIIGFQVTTAELQPWLLNVLIVLIMIVCIMVGLLFFGLRPAIYLARKTIGRLAEKKFFRVILNFIEDVAEAVDITRKAGLSLTVLWLSIAVRLTKYVGLYFIFLAVARPSFPDLAGASFGSVLCSLLSAEGAASLPLPTFMSFGTYEAGGTLALTMLGFSVAGSKIAMLSLHIWSQFVDYILGGAGFITFVFLTGKYNNSVGQGRTFRQRRRVYMLAICAVITGLAGIGYLGMQYRKTQKMGAIAPPAAGEAVTIELNVTGGQEKQESIKGFMVWSSNRHGSHDVLRMSLPDRKIEQLTESPHVDTYPRISPDGTKVVFCRSHEKWVSQRNPVPWDIWILDLETGKEKLLAELAFTPSWVADGKSVIFVRNGNAIIRVNIESKKETVLYKSGKNGIPDGIVFQTPSYNQKLDAVAVTMRGIRRGTAVIRDGKIIPVGGGCELVWVSGNDAAQLCYVDHDGRDNIIYCYNFDSGKREQWVNLDGSLSHEYFPKLSNDGRYLVFGASSGGRSQHEHDTSDYEIFLWKRGAPIAEAVRLTHHTGNDCWPDIFVRHE